MKKIKKGHYENKIKELSEVLNSLRVKIRNNKNKIVEHKQYIKSARYMIKEIKSTIKKVNKERERDEEEKRIYI